MSKFLANYNMCMFSPLNIHMDYQERETLVEYHGIACKADVLRGVPEYCNKYAESLLYKLIGRSKNNSKSFESAFIRGR